MTAGGAPDEQRRPLPARLRVGLLAAILVMSLGPRLYRINAPFLDAWWMREMQNHSIAVNYLENGVNLLWPQTDFTPDRANYTGQEFPLVPALAAIGWRITGINEWLPRALSIVWSLLGIVVFHTLMRRFLSDEGALAAALFFALVPMNAYLGRKFMVEPLTLLCVLVSLWMFIEWVDEGHVVCLIASAGIGALAVVMRPPVLHYALPLAWYLWYRKGAAGYRTVHPYLFAAALLLPVMLYMKHMAVLRAMYFGVNTSSGGGLWFSTEFLFSPRIWSLFISRFTKETLTPFGIVGVALGLPLLRRRSRQWFLLVWLIAVIGYFLAVLGGNTEQAYYQLWFIPPCAGMIGYAWQRFRSCGPTSRLTVPVAVLGLVTWCGWGTEPLYEYHEVYAKAAAALDEVDPEDSWIVVYPAGYNCLYYLGRDGWCGRDKVYPAVEPAHGNPDYITERVRRGARYCVILTGGIYEGSRDLVVEEYLAREAACLYEDPAFAIYRIDGL